MPDLPSQLGSFTLKEAAFLTHVSRSMLGHHCHTDVLKGYRTANSWRVGRDALIEYMERFNIPLDLATQGSCPQTDAYPPKDFKHKEKS